MPRYEHLSHDDERAGESVSIENQKRILEDYAQKNGFTNIRHFTDDGVRGTTFKRPGLDAMLEEIRAGNVAMSGPCCIWLPIIRSTRIVSALLATLFWQSSIKRNAEASFPLWRSALSCTSFPTSFMPSCETRTALPAYQAGRLFPLRRCHAVKGTVRPALQWRQVFIEVISHAFPPFCFPLPFSPKRFPAPFLRRIPALARSPQLRDKMSRSPAPCGASPAGVFLFGRSFCFQGAVHR